MVRKCLRSCECFRFGHCFTSSKNFRRAVLLTDVCKKSEGKEKTTEAEKDEQVLDFSLDNDKRENVRHTRFCKNCRQPHSPEKERKAVAHVCVYVARVPSRPSLRFIVHLFLNFRTTCSRGYIFLSNSGAILKQFACSHRDGDNKNNSSNSN